MTVPRLIPVVVLEIIQDLLAWMRTTPSPGLATLLNEVGSLLDVDSPPRLLKPKVVGAIDRYLMKTGLEERKSQLLEKALRPLEEVEVAEKDLGLLILGCRGFVLDRGAGFEDWATTYADAFHALPEIMATGTFNRYGAYRVFFDTRKIRKSCRLTDREITIIRDWVSDIPFEDKSEVWFPMIYRLLWKTHSNLLTKPTDEERWTL